MHILKPYYKKQNFLWFSKSFMILHVSLSFSQNYSYYT